MVVLAALVAAALGNVLSRSTLDLAVTLLGYVVLAHA